MLTLTQSPESEMDDFWKFFYEASDD